MIGQPLMGLGSGGYVTVAVAVGLGSIHEGPGLEGLAHLYEHLVVARLKRVIEECRQDPQHGEVDVTVSARTYTFHTEIGIDLFVTGDTRFGDILGRLCSALRSGEVAVSVDDISLEARSIGFEVSARGGFDRLQRTPAYVPHAVYTDRPGARNSYALARALTRPDSVVHCAQWERAFQIAPVGFAVHSSDDATHIEEILRTSLTAPEESEPLASGSLPLTPRAVAVGLDNRSHTQRNLNHGRCKADGWVAAAPSSAGESDVDLRATCLVIAADNEVMTGKRFGLYGPLRGPDGWILLLDRETVKPTVHHWFGLDADEHHTLTRTRAVDSIDDLLSSNEGVFFEAREMLYGVGHEAFRDAVARVKLSEVQDVLADSRNWTYVPFVLEEDGCED